MHSLIFHPDDVLFFRDGRPMSGAQLGHGDSMPHPHIVNSALHVALHRAFGNSASHGKPHRLLGRERNKRRKDREVENKTERFGDLVTAGPFPFSNGEWYYPAPADLQDMLTRPSLLPRTENQERLCGKSSLRGGLHPLVNTLPPKKDREGPEWLTLKAFETYLTGGNEASEGLKAADAFFSTEYTMGIGIDPETGANVEGAFFSKAQMRLRPGCSLGAFAEFRGQEDLIDQLFPKNGKILLGGETRSCSVERASIQGYPLPLSAQISGTRVKWVLLTPAIFPFLPAEGKRKEEHPGGWLPSWIDATSLEVRLLSGVGGNKAKRLKLPQGEPIHARLVSALIQRPLPITGWSIREDDERSGARSTLLAVPAGSIYYFEADTQEDARRLSNALSWHGENPSLGNLVNRRSGLMGEKGFGIGVCGAWAPHAARQATS